MKMKIININFEEMVMFYLCNVLAPVLTVTGEVEWSVVTGLDSPVSSHQGYTRPLTGLSLLSITEVLPTYLLR